MIPTTRGGRRTPEARRLTGPSTGGGVTPYGGVPPATPTPTPTIPLVTGTPSGAPPPPGTPPVGTGTQLQQLLGASGQPGGAGTPTDPSVLGKFGYRGDIAINPLEQQGMDYASSLLAGGTPGEQLAPAQSLYEQVLSGEFAPQGEQFRSDVYGATQTGAMENLKKMQDMMAENFAQRGGYFGGKHGIAQAELGRGVGSDLSQLLAGLNLQGFQSDIANRMGAAQGMGGLGATQRGMESSLLGDVMGAGGVGSQRDLINQQLYQSASDRAYQDWMRARQETMMPFTMAQGLLGMQPTQTFIQQPQSPFGPFAQGVGQAATTALLASSKEFKKDISGITEEVENEIFEKMKGIQLFNYRYKFEPDDNPKHLGLITEESPEELTFFNKKAIGLCEYISMLHIAVKVMVRKIEMLERQLKK